MKVFYLNPEKQVAAAREIEDELQTYYDMIGCYCIDIVRRTIGGVRFTVVRDDNGLWVNKNPVSAIGSNGAMFVGNIVICKDDDLGNLYGLSDEEIKILTDRLHKGVDKWGRELLVLTDVEYWRGE